MKKLTRMLFKNVGEFFSNPSISALCQGHPLTAGIATYFGEVFQQEQYETMYTFVHQLHSRLGSVEVEKVDREFLSSNDGKRIIGKIFRSVARDNRIEKINAMSNLTVNLYIKSRLTVDEKEVYVDILDNLNVLQLSILQNAVWEIKARTGDQHRGFSWEKMQKKYEGKGVTGALLLQSIRALESNGLINENTAQIQGEDRTHFVTFFGEQFYAFISDPLTVDCPYIL
jgi:DNA replication initiation complex subunit (GINS family)